MAKVCKVQGCNNFVFGKGYCRYHQYLRVDKRRSRIPKWSRKRARQEQEYRRLIAEIDREAKAKGEYKCFFDGEQIDGRADHHHLKGRDGDLLTEKKYIVLAKRKNHLDYHHRPVAWLKEQWWYEDFLKRLLDLSDFLYLKELKKQDK